MTRFRNLAIMPKQSRQSLGHRGVAIAPYPNAPDPNQKAAAIWSSTDDEILLQARASGLNWQPIATRHFPNKTANACRKRHERLLERRHFDDWDAHKLEMLATEYMICRREMWEVLASRLGERWTVVEAKCMEKGFKTLQSTARIAQRKATASYQPADDHGGTSDHNSDSGIGFGSEAEMETGEAGRSAEAVSGQAGRSAEAVSGQAGRSAEAVSGQAGRSAEAVSGQAGQMPECTQTPSRQEHGRSRSLPQPLPFYYPPQLVRRTVEDRPVSPSPHEPLSLHASATSRRCSPDSQSGRISIQSVLSG